MDKLIEAVEAGEGPGIQLDAESTVVHWPVSLNCKIRVDPELLERCRQHGEGVFRAKPIGRISSIWPFEALKLHLLEQTKEFYRQIRSRGYDPLQAETEMLAFGPIREKADLSNTRLVNIEEGNPFFPDGRWVADNRGARKVTTNGPIEITRDALFNSSDWEKGAVFLVRGRFLATHGKQEESTGTLLV